MSFAPPPMPRVVESLPRGPVLVIAPHPDDEMVGPGGALLRHRAAGDALHVLIVFDGSLGDPEGHFASAGYVDRRLAESSAVATDFLGGAEVTAFRFVDGVTEGNVDAIYPGLPEDPDEKRRVLVSGLAGRIEAELQRIAPRVVYYPWIGEAHADHWGCAAAVEQLRENRPELRATTSFIGYEVWSTLLPELLLDVTEVMAEKVAAIERYETQTRYVALGEIVKGMNRYRAMLLPFAAEREERYAEAFLGSFDLGEPS